MAHNAELKAMTDPTGFTSDSHQVVQRVVVVGNDIPAGDGILGNNDMHQDGETWCINFFGGGIWKQTSYNHNFRKRYAGIGMIYDPVKDKFLSQQPYASWSLDDNDDWQAPVAYPNVDEVESNPVSITWYEPNQEWVGKTYTGVNLQTETDYVWNASSLEWNKV